MSSVTQFGFGDGGFLKLDSMIENNDVNVTVNRLRVHYFFSTLESHIEDFLSNTQITIRLTDGDNWNKCIAEGKIKPFELLNKQDFSRV